MTKKIIWALTDGRPGNDNQTIAVAESLGEYSIKPIEFSKWAKLPNFLLRKSACGIITKIEAPYPDIVIATGRKLSRVARIIKKRSNAKIIQLMWPDFGAAEFDIIFSPQHDQLKPRSNLIETIGSPNRVNSELLAREADKWRSKITNNQTKIAAVLIGSISDDEAKLLASCINKINAYPVITTSRRTSASVIEILKQCITRERYLYEWKLETENPYYGFLGLADFIICTEDSISMMAESCTTGKPTYIFTVKTPAKHKIFSTSLFKSGCAKPFTGQKLENYNYTALNTLQFITRQITERI